MKIVKLLLLKLSLFAVIVCSASISLAQIDYGTIHPPATTPEGKTPEVPLDTEENLELKDLQMEFSGIFRMWALTWLKPSAKEYQSEFKIPQIDFILDFIPANNIHGHIEAVVATSRDANSESWDTLVNMAYLEFVKVFGSEVNIRYGLVPNFYIESQKEVLTDNEFISHFSGYFSNRYGYTTATDLGASALLKNDALIWALNVVNGEGDTSDEKGYGKEAQAVVRWFPLKDWREKNRNLSVMLSWTEGSYENVGPEAKKRRIQGLLLVDRDVGFGGQAEVLWAKDPVDAVTGVIADQVDLSAHPGESADAFGYSGQLLYSWRDGKKPVKKYQVYARYDNVDPMQSVEDCGLDAQLLGFSYFPRKNLHFSLTMAQVNYEENHSAAVRDQQEINFATRVNF